MLDIFAIQVVSAFLAVVLIVRFLWSLLFARFIGEGLGSVRVSKHIGLVIAFLCVFLNFVPIIFCLLGAILPSWVYGTFLNFSFNGVEFLQVASVPIILFGAVLGVWSSKNLGQQASDAPIVREKHSLITTGPYSRIRHPGYTARMIIDWGVFLLFLNGLQLICLLAWIGVAYRKAVLEEELLASEQAFGKDYSDYMLRTGRFLPKLRARALMNSRLILACELR
jgi:protein-S-isoprenylcysteine O-methyltransferase Ste14